MSSAVLEMPKKPGEPNKRGPGRPKGSGPGRIESRFAAKVSPEYKAWLDDFATKSGVTEADLFREAMRRLATEKKFRIPPIR
jgi:hypothetical protein